MKRQSVLKKHFSRTGMGLFSGLLVIVLLVGCGQDTEKWPVPKTLSPSPDESTPEGSPLPIPTPSVEPTSTLTPSPVPVDDYPELSDTRLTQDFLFDNASDDCQLPCWHRLVPGESGQSEIVEVFGYLLNLDPNYQLFPHNPPTPQYGPPDLYATSFGWGNYEEGRFAINILYNLPTYILQGIEFQALGPRYTQHLTPRRVIRELGQPSAFLMSWHGIGMGYGYYNLASLRLRLVYNQGVVFTIEKDIPIYLILEEKDEGENKDHESGHIEICLGGDAWWEKSDPLFWRIDLVEPMPEGLENLTPIQADIITDFDSVEWSSELYPVSDFFGLSLEEITQLALEDEDACLYTEFSFDILRPTPVP